MLFSFKFYQPLFVSSFALFQDDLKYCDHDHETYEIDSTPSDSWVRISIYHKIAKANQVVVKKHRHNQILFHIFLLEREFAVRFLSDDKNYVK